MSDEADDFLVVSLPGVSVDDATRRAAIAHAQADGLDVVDLVPGDLSGERAVELARVVDTRSFRTAPLAAGRSAAHALLVRRAVWDRMVPPCTGRDERWDQAGFVHLATRLKLHAARSMDFVVAPGLRAVESSAQERLSQLEVLVGGALPLALAFPAARSSLLLAGLILSPTWGAAAAAAALLQPYLVTSGGAVHPPRRSPLKAARGLIAEPFALLRAASAGHRDATEQKLQPDDPVESRRPYYDAALAQGTEHFFESRRASCPWCGSTVLAERLRTPDLYQFKPGEFVMDECAGCGVVFQNPRLSLDGLDFYYRDFYEGLGAAQFQFLWAKSEPVYRDRVGLARRHVSPRTWLDVGTGYGHFCNVARGVLPGTQFHGIDMGTSVEEGQRRRWIDRGYRGLFPDLVDELTGRYDLVSMHHYLEHTRDPGSELDAAHEVLEPGGHLLIEVPDPECRFARLLGRYWVPWLQPQHLLFLPVANLCAALEERGFSIVEVEYPPASPGLEVLGAVWTWSTALAPPGRLPWRDSTAATELRHWMVLAVMAPVGVVGVAVGSALQPFIRRSDQPWSNAYRVLARRD